jgi:hypothetical protein
MTAVAADFSRLSNASIDVAPRTGPLKGKMLWLGLGALVLSACPAAKGKDAGAVDDFDPGPLSASELFCRRLAEARCEQGTRCQGWPEADRALCIEAGQSECRPRAAKVTSGMSAFAPAAAEACVAALAGCQVDFFPPSCGDAFKPAAAVGAECEPGDCLPGLYCKAQPGGCSRCASIVQKGESCAVDPCADDLVCDAVTQTCTEPPKGHFERCIGSDTCEAPYDCRAELDGGRACLAPVTQDACPDGVCDRGPCVNGTCGTPVVEGGACIAPQDCVAGKTCIRGHCGRPVEPGGACTQDFECRVGGCRDFGSDAGMCIPLPTGASCSSDDECESTLCEATHCVSPSPHSVMRGGHCRATDECVAGLSCNHGLCLAQVAVGQPCTSPYECLDGVQCQDGVCKRQAVLLESCTGTCVDYLTCSLEGTCAPQLVTGQVCDPEVLFGCLDSDCDPNTHLCVPLRRDGQPCQRLTQCRSHTCSNGTCVSVCQ